MKNEKMVSIIILFASSTFELIFYIKNQKRYFLLLKPTRTIKGVCIYNTFTLLENNLEIDQSETRMACGGHDYQRIGIK
jgi:hypothetical protein